MEKIQYEKIKHINQIRYNRDYEIKCLVVSVAPRPEGTNSPGRITVLDGRSQSAISVFPNDTGYAIITKEMVNTVFSFKLHGGEFRGKIQPNIISYTPLNMTEEEKKKFAATAPEDPEAMFSAILAGMKNNALVTSIYGKYEQELKRVAAAQKNHHVYVGGLLYHTYRMVRVAICLLKAKGYFLENNTIEDTLDKVTSAISPDFFTKKILNGIYAEIQQNEKIANEVRASFFIASALSTIYSTHSDLEVIASALFLSIYAREKIKEQDEYLGIPKRDAYGYEDVFQTDAVITMDLEGKKEEEDKQPEKEGEPPKEKEKLSEEDKLRRKEKLNEIKFCCTQAFSSIKDRSQAHTMNSLIVYFVLRLLQAGFHEFDIDREILLSSVVLHDIGKVIELETSEIGATEYTPAGQAYGHLLLGMKIVRKMAASGKYDPRIIANVVHCIASHHGFIEWGALAEPQTIEAKILFILDMLDSRVEPIEDAYEGMHPGDVRTLTNGCVAVKAPVPDIDGLLETQPENKSDTAR